MPVAIQGLFEASKAGKSANLQGQIRANFAFVFGMGCSPHCFSRPKDTVLAVDQNHEKRVPAPGRLDGRARQD
jgi:hypothetical protein